MIIYICDGCKKKIRTYTPEIPTGWRVGFLTPKEEGKVLPRNLIACSAECIKEALEHFGVVNLGSPDENSS